MTATKSTRPPLVLSRLDANRLEALLEQPGLVGPNIAALQDELLRAEVVEPSALPADVISMNSIARVRLEDPQMGSHEYELTLVYPRDADGSAEKVSILAPVGSALLGLRMGDAIDWPMPSGRNARLHVLSVRYQPEAAGDFTR